MIQLINPLNISPGRGNTITPVTAINAPDPWPPPWGTPGPNTPFFLVPVGNFVYDDDNDLWTPEKAGPGGIAIVSVAQENEYYVINIDLTNAQGTQLNPLEVRYPHPAGVRVSGKSLTVRKLDGTCSLYFGTNADPNIPGDELDFQPFIWPNKETYVRDFNSLYIWNTAQANKSLQLYVGRRV